MGPFVLLPGEPTPPLSLVAFGDLVREYMRCQTKMHEIRCEVMRRTDGTVVLGDQSIKPETPF